MSRSWALRYAVRMPKKTIQISAGDTHGLFTVIEAGLRKDPSPSRAKLGVKSEAAVRVRCACGSELLVRPTDMRNPDRLSCGCLGRRRAATRCAVRNRSHGLTSHPSYARWSGMVRRCTQPASRDYPRYGGRGVTVDPTWLDAAAFLAYLDGALGPRPEGCSLDRIDNGRGYEPGNVRWADRKTQRRNQDRYRGGV